MFVPVDTIVLRFHKQRGTIRLQVWQTASLYHLVHTAALLAALIAKHPNIFGGLLTTGIVAFSGTATRQLDSSRGPAHIPDAFKFDVDAYMQDMDMLPLDDSLEFSGDMKDLRCHRERLPDFQDQIDLDGDYNIMDNSSSDMKKHFQDIEDNKKYLWDATSRFSDEDLLCERSCEASWKNWPCKQGGTSVKFSNSDEQLILDDTFERPQKRNKRKLLCLGALTNRLALSR